MAARVFAVLFINPVGGTPPNVTAVNPLATGALSPYIPTTRTVVLSSRSKPVTAWTLEAGVTMPFCQPTTLTSCADAGPQISSSIRALEKKPRQRLIHEHGRPGRRLCTGCDWVGSHTIWFDVASAQHALKVGLFMVLSFF